MKDVAIMEERARWSLFKGLKHALTYSALESKKKKAKWTLGLAIPISMALMAIGIVMADNGSDLMGLFAIVLYTVSFITGFIISMIAIGDLENLRKPNTEDFRKLDLAMKSSKLIRGLLLDDKFSNQIQLTKALVNELYSVAKSEASGEYLKAWSEVRSQYTQ